MNTPDKRILTPPPPRTGPVGQVTTVWADGSVVRTNPQGRPMPRPSVPAIFNSTSK